MIIESQTTLTASEQSVQRWLAPGDLLLSYFDDQDTRHEKWPFFIVAIFELEGIFSDSCVPRCVTPLLIQKEKQVPRSIVTVEEFCIYRHTFLI